MTDTNLTLEHQIALVREAGNKIRAAQEAVHNMIGSGVDADDLSYAINDVLSNNSVSINLDEVIGTDWSPPKPTTLPPSR